MGEKNNPEPDGLVEAISNGSPMTIEESAMRFAQQLQDMPPDPTLLSERPRTYRFDRFDSEARLGGTETPADEGQGYNR